MDVISHQHIGVQAAARLRQRLPQPVQIAQVVILREEAGLAVMTALDDVQRNTVELHAWAARHAADASKKSQKLEPGPFKSPFKSLFKSL